MDDSLDDQLHHIQGLVRLCLARLPEMIEPASGLVVFREDGDELLPAGTSARYTAMTAIGLEHAARHGWTSKLEANALRRALGEVLDGITNSGDLGLVLWAAAQHDRPLAERALEALLGYVPLTRDRHGDAVHGTELAWVVTGLAEAIRADVGRTPEVRARFDHAFRLLEQQRGASGLVAFAKPISTGRDRPPGAGPSGARSISLRLQSELGFFDAQVYAIVAGLARHEITGDPAAAEMARTIGVKIMEHQHPLGQWAWHYNVRRGTVVDLYPVYSVHQDGMAPMALLPLERALGVPTSAAVARGVAWLFGGNELATAMVDEERGIIWRSIRRKESLRSVVYPLKLASLAGVGQRLDLGARLAIPGALEIDREMRPYHLGWCLLAFAELASQARRPKPEAA
jgi:hypothetical protein